ncbi:ankyrin repeat and zinc finger domain-containing protein 1-like isoform X2 [Centruroides sculpturatus]|uniref:ankyrin repeat and zinc finger domain-containing protein 1-like isoform X2 n=1 Tax=Centruroides sculpturatus TaxID=218467 RepID=UPI000C6E7981|nr:ankyrin repeat and zinc finger domain-containing protein 1-like isoform X2 [Centruroides sculpturatus]
MRRERSASVTSTDTETDDSERPDKNSVTQSRLQPKLYFRNQFHKIIALYRCVVHGKQNVPKNQRDLLNMVTAIPNQMYWAIILIGGGHFAAAVYNQSEIILHKTFHRYTVRAKQGSAQSSRDGKHGGSQPKSAGASLRRHNEASLVKEIQDLLQSWNTDLQKCSCIFYRAPSFNRVTLFRGKNPPFKKDDCRLRNIPFPTRRATFKEVQRVYRLLSTLECFGDVSEEDKQIPKSPKVYLGSKKVKKKSSDLSLNCGNLDKIQDSENSKSGKQRFRKPATNKKEGYKYKTEGIVLAEEKSELSDSKLSDLDNSMEFQLVEEMITTSDLKEMTVPKRRKHKSRKNSLTKRQQDPAMDVLSEENYLMKSALYTACQTGDVQELEKLLNILKSRMLPVDTKKEDLNDKCNSSQNSITLRNCDKVQTEEPRMHDNSTSDIEIEYNSNESLKQDETKVYFSVNDDKEMKLDFSPVQDGNPKPNRILNMDLSSSKPSKRRNKSGTGGEFNSPLLTVDVLNEVISDGGATLLHVATKEGHQGVVKMLMECGANPTLRDKRGLTPYMASNDREMRNVYRRFMAENPNRFDYKSAEIPSPLSEEMMAERLEKKKEKQKLKKERLKEKKAVEMQKKLEEEEKKRYLSLSDREKRALAAERRYLGHLSQTGQPTVVLSRCFQCGVDITGKTPFEYNDSRFCSTECVKSHRKCGKS